MKLCRKVILLLGCAATPLGSGCGVEAGNPNSGSGGSKTTGLVSINLTDSPIADIQHVYLSLQTLSIVPLNSDGSSGTPVEVELANSGRIDALALHSGNTLGLVSSQSLPVGNYSSVVLGLASGTPASIVQNGGQESPLPLAGSANQIVVSQQFTLQDSQDLALLLDLDLQRSISGNGGGTPFSFSPYANLNINGQQGQIDGTVADTTLTEVCAYLFRQTPDNDEGPLNYPGPPPTGSGQGGGNQGGGMGGPGGGPQGSVTAQPPPSFAPGVSFNPQTDGSGCSQSFATATITGGSFDFNPLWPGQYQLVFYKSDGTLSSAQANSAPINVAPGQTVQVMVPTSGVITSK